MLLSLDNVTFGFSDVPILEQVSFSLQEGERVGLLGGNGEGKTTILKLILGELQPDSGEIFLKSGIRIGYLPQTSDFDSESTVYDAMREVLSEDETLISRLREAERQFSEAKETERASLAAQMEALNKRIAARDSYHIDVKIRTVLFGMGFEDKLSQRVQTMSGGEKTRLKLCRLLLEEPDLLILDEPTNHLDVKTLFFLEEYLSSLKGAFLIVSHDRYFLDRLTTKTLELSDKTVTSYKGNYSKYKILREERYREQLAAYEARQEEIAKLKEYIAKNGVRASTAKSAHSRENKLERMTLLKKPSPPPRPPRFCFEYDRPPFEKVVSAPKFDLYAEEKLLLKAASFELLRGEKCALTGENGTGKSTLLKFLLREGNQVVHGGFAKIGYYDQENSELNPEETVLECFRERNRTADQTQARSALARCGLMAEDMDKKVRELSGGKLARLKLCLLESKRANALFLDEPTNHLDLPAREALEEALKAYDGTILFVSHDRRFLEAVADHIAVIENGVLEKFDGTYDAFLKSRSASSPKPKAEAEKKPAEGKSEGYRSKEDRAREAKKKERVRDLEQQIEALECEQASSHEKMVQVAANYLEVKKISERLSEIEKELERLYAEYETLL